MPLNDSAFEEQMEWKPSMQRYTLERKDLAHIMMHKSAGGSSKPNHSVMDSSNGSEASAAALNLCTISSSFL